MKTAGLAIALIGVLLPFAPRCAEFIAVDRCLDQGGSYNYTLRECDLHENHPYVSWAQRQHSTAPALVGLGLVIVGVLIFLRARTDIHHRS